MTTTGFRLAPLGAIGLAAITLAGCSTNIARLENPPPVTTAEQAPRPAAPVYAQRSGTGGPLEPNAWPNSGPRGALPPPAVQTNTARIERGAEPAPLTGAPIGTVGPSLPFDAGRPKADPRAAAAPIAPPRPAATGATFEVQPGDTLFGLAKKHKVSIAALMEANGLRSPDLKPGQKLVLPSAGQRPLSKPNKIAGLPGTPLPPVAVPAAPTIPAPDQAATNWGGTHTIKSGESLYGLSRTYKVPLAELQRVNGITEPTKVRPGTVLKVPGAAPTSMAAGPAPASDASRAPVVPAAPAIPPTKMLNGGAEARPDAAPVEAAPARPSRIAALPSAATTKFRWPVRGKMLAEFGKRPDGTHNDGVNIAVPAGTDIAAAETGTVAYAGGELKGYGNLILVRHDNGWVSAYAHADQILVKRGDTVRRGQVIAKAGSTGTVDQSQVHFELRHGSKPVDPLPHMEK